VEMNRGWKADELAMLDAILGLLPERHTTFNEAIAEIVRGEYLSHGGKSYLSALGIYRPSARSATLFTPAFGGNLELGSLVVPTFDFTLLTLVGHSLFNHPTIMERWPRLFRPGVDRHEAIAAKLQLLERERIHEEICVEKKALRLDAKLPLERAFALAYTSYIVAPRRLFDAYTSAYHFLKESVFAGKEYRGEEPLFRSSGRPISV